MKEVLHFINGEYTASQSGKTFDKVDPATGQVIAHVASGDTAEVNAAVAAAKHAFDSWGKLPQQERSRLLMNLAAAIDRRADDFIAAEVADTGKPWSLASHLDIPRGAANFVQFAEHFKYIATECWENLGQNALNYAIRRPTGVVAVISPWNLPLLLMTWKVAPALAAGNCVVVKPSRETPSTASLLGEVMNEVGIPKGVYNVVQGPGTLIGAALSRHPDVHALTFTGETTTGQTIMGDCAQTLKKLSFELGGKNPNIIFADAPLEECLDVTLRSQVLDLLLDLQDTLNLSFILVSHDIGVIRYFCDRVAVMYKGQVVEHGPAEKICSNPDHPYTKALISAVPGTHPRDKRKSCPMGVGQSPTSVCFS